MGNRYRQIKLKEISSYISRGITPSYADDGVCVINQKCIRDNKLTYDLSRFTSYEKKITEKKLLQHGDILINSTGTGTLGRVAYKNDDKVATCDGHVTILRVEPSENARYINYYLFQIQSVLENLGKGSTNQLELSAKDIGNIKLNIPDLEIQNKIASILSNYDELVEKNNRKIEILQEMAEELYKEWFVRFRFPGYKNTKIENGLPMGWKTKKYAEEINIKYGKGLPTERLLAEGYPVFGSNGIIGYYSKYMYEKPQILISCRGASSGVVNISLPNSFVTSNSLVCEMCETLTESTFEYLKYYFLNTNLVQYQTGSAQPQITIDNIKKLKIVIPPRNIQEKFSSMVIPIDQDLLLLKNQNKNLKQQRDLLLPRLMSGKLEVKGDAHA